MDRRGWNLPSQAHAPLALVALVAIVTVGHLWVAPWMDGLGAHQWAASTVVSGPSVVAPAARPGVSVREYGVIGFTVQSRVDSP